MIGKIELTLLAIIQVVTLLTILFSKNEKELFNIKMLPKELSIFRYLLASLWMSVSIIYILGVIKYDYFNVAKTLALINISLEIISYWCGYFKNRQIKKLHIISGTILMMIPFCLILLDK